jgi:hypothetical protein
MARARRSSIVAWPSCHLISRMSPRRQLSSRRLPSLSPVACRPGQRRRAVSAVCPSICREKMSSSSPAARHVPAARALCISLARMSARCWTSYPPSSRSGGSGGHAMAAVAAKAPWCKLRHRRAPSKVACRRRRYSPMLPCRNSPGTCRSTAKSRCCRVSGSRSTAPPWCIGSRGPHGGCGRFRQASTHFNTPPFLRSSSPRFGRSSPLALGGTHWQEGLKHPFL